MWYIIQIIGVRYIIQSGREIVQHIQRMTEKQYKICVILLLEIVGNIW